MDKTIRQLQEHCSEVLFNEELSKYSSFMIGGPADYLCKIKNTEEVSQLIQFARKNKIPHFIIGGGSNILFDDKGFRGLILKIETNNIEVNGDEITADAGVKIAQLIKIAIENDLAGLEKWLGLPGTVGGAVRGNAGCNGLETKDILTKALILDPETGKTEELENKDFQFSYRHSKIKDSNKIVLKATFKLKKGSLSPEERKEIMAEIQKFRLTKQPFGLSSGSFFKNPSSEKPAGMLIDQAGLKGRSIGNAQISEKHGNFFLNNKGATSEDMKALANLAKREVKAKFGIGLEEEVQIISEHGPISL